MICDCYLFVAAKDKSGLFTQSVALPFCPVVGQWIDFSWDDVPELISHVTWLAKVKSFRVTVEPYLIDERCNCKPEDDCCVLEGRRSVLEEDGWTLLDVVENDSWSVLSVHGKNLSTMRL